MGLGAGSPGPLADYLLDSYTQGELAQTDFFSFLDDELEKIEAVLQERRRTNPRTASPKSEHSSYRAARAAVPRHRENQGIRAAAFRVLRVRLGAHLHLEEIRFLSPISRAWNVVRNGKVGAKSIAMEGASTPVLREDRRDYVRRRAEEAGAVPYRSAKRKLKMALIEYYRGLELLKAYAMLNRKAFRKHHAVKYDKRLHFPRGSSGGTSPRR